MLRYDNEIKSGYPSTTETSWRFLVNSQFYLEHTFRLVRDKVWPVDLSTPDLYDILDAIAALRGKLYGGTLRTGSARDQHSGSAVALLLVGHLDGRNG